MQGLTIMTKPTIDEHTKAILADRKLRAQSRREEMRALSKYKRRLENRMAERDWPIDAFTMEKADLDPYDVSAPLPDDIKQNLDSAPDEDMMRMRAEADVADRTQVVDPTLAIARRTQFERERGARDAVRGPAWTEDLVEARIEEAFRTLFRASAGGVGPRAFGNAMPPIVREMSDMVAQAGNRSLRKAVARLVRNGGPPSTDEVRRANETLMWAMDYLKDEDPDLAMFFNLSAMWKAWGAKVTRKCAEMGIHRQVFYRDKRIAVKIIVAGLIRDGRAPT